MAFSPRKRRIDQHQANTDKETKSQNEPALHRCNGQRDGECGREEWGSGTGASSWAEPMTEGGERLSENGKKEKKKKKKKRKEKKTTLPGASSGKIKVGCELPDPVFSVHFLQFHPAVLKPDFNLSVREVDAAADL